MDLLKQVGERSSIHGISDLVKAKTLRNRIFWTLALVGVACLIPYNVYSVLRDFKNAPSVTFIAEKSIDGYTFPLIRFCPRSWINSSRISDWNLEKDELIYALSLLLYVTVNSNLTNVTEAKMKFRDFRHLYNISHLREFYIDIAYDGNALFRCAGCVKVGDPVLTILGVCYDFTFRDYKPDGTVGQNSHYNLVFHPIIENYSDPTNVNNLYKSAFLTDVLYVNVDPLDSFGFEPMFLERNKSYNLAITPTLSVRLPGKGQKPCLNEVGAHSIDLCQVDCREFLHGSKCWGYMHYGLVIDKSRLLDNLSWYSSLEEYALDDESVKECERSLLDELMKCMNTCYAPCRQWEYDLTLSEISQGWRPSLRNSTGMSGAAYIAWRRGVPTKTNRKRGQSVTGIIFSYEARHGITAIEQKSRYSASTFFSNVGGMMGLVAGASMLSLCQLVECVVRFFLKRIQVRRQEYSP